MSAERLVVGQHATGGGVHAKDRQAVLERNVERAAHAAVLEHVLVRNHVRHAEDEATRQVAVIEVQTSTAPLRRDSV